MRTPKDRDVRGPVESGDWPRTLPAHVISPDVPRRVHGYALLADLAQNYDFGEVVFTTLSGRPPEKDWGLAINLAFTALAGTSVADAPIHAATLSRRCTAPPRAAIAIGMLGLAEQADRLLSAPRNDAAPDPDALEFWRQLPGSVQDKVGSPAATAEELAMNILRVAGLTTETQLIAAISLARIPALAAELDAVEPGDVRNYPMRLPDFRYRGDDE